MTKKPFKTILIDPYKMQVRLAETDGSLQSMYDLLDCELVERSPLLRSIPDATQWDYAWVDEEGLHRQRAGFQLGAHPQVLMGRALILRGNGPTRLKITDLMGRIVWVV